jgi:hypothetical protein
MTLTTKDFEDAATALNCDVAAIQAVCEVEAPKGGFNPDGTPVTLFEGHKFYKYTNGKFNTSNPDLCFPVWTKFHYGKTWKDEQTRLRRAIELDREAAMMSASWGKFQIMGFNHLLAGHGTIGEFVTAMYKSEREHLMAFVSFVQKTGLSASLRHHDWAAFAKGYNGASYASNSYDVKLSSAFAKFKSRPIEAAPIVTPAAPTKTVGLLALVLKVLHAAFKGKA